MNTAAVPPIVQKPIEIVPIPPPCAEERARRITRPATEGERKTRYHLPARLTSSSPVGYRTRVPLTSDDAAVAVQLLSLDPPSAFADGPAPTERELFDESSLGVLTARQSTNYRGHRQVTLGPADSAKVAGLLRGMRGGAEAIDGATHTHVVLSRPYRTPFTFLLTFIGHRPGRSLLTVAKRAWDKRVHHADDIPTIGYLQQLHIGVLADAMERAAVVASDGTRRAAVHMAPFCGEAKRENARGIAAIEQLCGLTSAERRAGWRVAFVAQVGYATPDQVIAADRDTWRRIGANLLAFRSERIQPGVNQEDKAPPEYQTRQHMDVPDELTVQAGRAAYNAFARWARCDRELAKELMLLERVDVLTPNGKQRLREVREQLDSITDRVMKGIPLWADLPTGKRLSGNAARGKKAFALAGQRIYIGGLCRRKVDAAGLPFDLAVRAFGAAASRSALVAELMGVVELQEDCDLLAGICLMAGPVNQNDIGKSFYGFRDLLADAFPCDDPTSLLVWTLKAKTVADPIGNEEQLMNADRKGALVDLRAGPHDVVAIRTAAGAVVPMRRAGERTSTERAFADVGNFVTGPAGEEIVGNRGERWSGSDAAVW